MTTQATRIDRSSGIARAFEAGCLAAAVLVPIAIMHEDFMIGFIQMPKVFALRTVALYLVAVFAIEWAMGRWGGGPEWGGRVGSSRWRGAGARPCRPTPRSWSSWAPERSCSQRLFPSRSPP